MNFSKATNYALHIVIHLAMQEPKKYISLHELSTSKDIPSSYLSKNLTKLAKKGIVTSSSGFYGGYMLGKELDQISFLDIIQSIEGDLPRFKGCDGDNDPTTCIVENIMSDAENQMNDFLRKKTVKDVLHTLNNNKHLSI